MERIVVTGGIGFIGSSVVERLLNLGHKVVCVDYVRDRLAKYEKYRFPILRQVYKNLGRCADVLEPHELLASSNEMRRATKFIHLGACVDTSAKEDLLFDENVSYTRQLAQALPPGSHIVFGSSAATYGERDAPCNPYGLTKSIGEQILANNHDITAIALRFFNVFGRYEHHKGDMASVPFKIAQAYKNKNRFDMFCPDASRDFICVQDVTDAVVGHTMDVQGGFHVYDVGYGASETFEDLDYKLQILHGYQNSICKIVPMPEKFKGRYQGYTRAGRTGNTIGHVLSPFVSPPSDFRDPLKEQFIDEDR